MSKRESIIAEVANALAGTVNVGSNIFRSRAVAFQRAETPCLNIEPHQDQATREAVGRLIWALDLCIMVIVRATDADSTADPIVVDVHSRLENDATLQNMLVDFLPTTTDWQFVEADQQLCVVSMNYKISYQTNENALN